MSGPPSLKSLVCEEVFDERSQPSEEEVREYAVRIGIDPKSESHLIPLAKEGLLKPLPKNWKPVYDQESKRYYYFNFKTNQTSWEHPLDSKFRDLVKKNRSESISSAGEEDSKTSIKEELKSFEEAGLSIGLEPDNSTSFKDNPMDFSLQGVPPLKSALSPLRTIKKDDQGSFSFRKDRNRPLSGKSDLKPLFTPKPLFSQDSKSKGSDKIQSKKADWDDYSSLLDDDSEPLEDVQGHRSGIDSKFGSSLDYNLLSHDHRMEPSTSSVIGRFTIDKVKKIDIDSQAKRLDSDRAMNTKRSSERFLKSGPEFTLSGGGSVFLKSNKKKSDEKKRGELSNSDGIDYELLKEPIPLESSLSAIRSSVRSLTSSPTISASSTRSILRTPQVEKRLWDVDPQQMSVSEKALWKQQELEEEKKSVRFNLDKELNISFKLSDSSDGDSSSEVEDDEEGEELDLNSNGSDDLDKEKLLPNASSEKNETPQSSSSKPKQLSPLEEWAKETWFSKKPSLDEELKDLAKLDSDFGLCKRNVLDSEKVNETGDLAKALNPPQRDEKILDDSMEVDVKSLEKSNELLSKKNLELSDIDEFLSSPLKSNMSLTSQDQLSTEAQLVESLTKKLKSTYKPPENIAAHRDAQAREEAFRNWNVAQTDDTYRPPLSRQQSQQQLQQIKHQIKEPTKVEDRERALRDWNVSDGSSNVVSFSKSSTPVEIDLHADSGMNFSPTISSEYLMERQSDSKVKVKETERDITPASKDTHHLVKDQEEKLKVDIEKLHSEYKIRLEKKKQEYEIKFDEEKNMIIQVQHEKLQKLLEEETKKNERKCKDVVSQMERESELRMKQIREQLEHKQNCSAQKILEQHQQSLAAQEVENQAAMLRFREQHSADMKTLREQFLREEEQARREHQEKVVSLREDRDGKRSREVTDHLRSIEKLRCEKRLVEDKYRILKEKYIKLKGEIKANVEKKEIKNKEVNHTDEKIKQNQPSAIEQEPHSQTQQQSDRSSETESKPKTASAGSSDTSKSLGFQQFQVQHQHQEQSGLLDPPSPAPNSGPSYNNNNDSCVPNVPFLEMSFCKPPFQENPYVSNRNGIHAAQLSWNNNSHFTTERNGNILTNGGTKWAPQNFNETTASEFSPLEALRHQLKTLDELEEQFPASSVTDAYLRYPFSDAGPKKMESAELEFFRHRIHLERDMIRQAKNTLQAQQTEYRTRMHNFQQRQTSSKGPSPSSTLYQMAKEEQELSDMESKLQRTRTILSEKMIHLRHLENSLNRLTAPSMRTDLNGRKGNGVPETRQNEKPRLKPGRRWDWKTGGLGIEDVSDEISSDSGGSSGFSSTEYTSDGTLASLLTHTGSGQRFKRNLDTTDINLSLHNLNAEISEIWNVLCKQRAAAGLGPPPLLSAHAAGTSSTSQHYPQNTTSTAHVGSSPGNPPISKVIQDKNSSLIERTNNLRQWLQKAKMSATLPSAAPSGEKNEVSF